MALRDRPATRVARTPGWVGVGVLMALAVALFAIGSAALSAEVAPGKGDTCVVAGKVVDAVTGRPLADITFTLAVEDSEKGESEYKTVRTNRDGTFAETVARNAEVTILWSPMNIGPGYILDYPWLIKTGNYMSALGALKKDRTGLVLKVKLRPVTKLLGKVVDPQGRAAKGAKVHLSQYVQPVTTNKSGEFVLQTAPCDRDYELLIVSADGKSGKAVKLKAGTTKAAASLMRTCEVRGRAVADDRKPAPDLTFWVRPIINGEELFVSRGSCKADGRGRFIIRDLCPNATYTAQWSGSMNAAYEDGSATVTATRGTPITLHVKRFVDNWKAPGNICISKETKCKNLTNFCLDSDDNILACDGAYRAIRVIGPDDKLISAWRLDFSPEAIKCRDDGTVVVAGRGKIVLLDRDGKMLKQSKLPGQQVTSVGCSGKEVFAAVQMLMGYNIYRMNSDLQYMKLIVKGLRGCCGQMDFAAKDGVLYVAANSLSKVVKYDRKGQELGRFGERARPGVEGFGGCCEPKNVCFDSQGYLYAAESDNCAVRKFTSDGQYLSSMGTVHGIRGCVRLTIALPKDCSRIYMLDTGRNIIRMLRLPAKKDSKGT